jgi:hypothetical protein
MTGEPKPRRGKMKAMLELEYQEARILFIAVKELGRQVNFADEPLQALIWPMRGQLDSVHDKVDAALKSFGK